MELHFTCKIHGLVRPVLQRSLGKMITEMKKHHVILISWAYRPWNVVPSSQLICCFSKKSFWNSRPLMIEIFTKQKSEKKHDPIKILLLYRFSFCNIGTWFYLQICEESVWTYVLEVGFGQTKYKRAIISQIGTYLNLSQLNGIGQRSLGIDSCQALEREKYMHK